jgi:ATP-dependent DNA helicase RecQ
MQSLTQILTKYWGYNHFRPLQEEIINSVMAGKDTMALLPTGGGKSVCYQVPAMAMDGICIVISPLIALIKDQTESLNNKGIKAISIVSGMQKAEIDIALDNCIYGNIKFLYLSPERLTNPLVQERIKKMKVNLLAIDEAHCISQWGYDFRPSYLKIAEVRELLDRKVPLLALTATATEKVKIDIQEKLLFKNQQIFQKSFERKNLSYVVFQEENKLHKMLDIIQKVRGTGIIYVRNRRKTKEISDFLNANKISSDYYHAGLDANSRSRKQDAWIKNKIRLIVATNAFGMGIDKPDVRFVIHLDLPDGPEAYYQEAGRCGRDEKKAYAILLCNKSDKLDIEERINLNFPDIETIRTVYQALANYYKLANGSGEGLCVDFNINEFCTTYNFTVINTYSALHILELEGLISISEAVYNPSRIHVTVNNDELYNFQVKNLNFDKIIKTILRSYEGIFVGYKKINEYELAKRIGIPTVELVKVLNILHSQQIISYIPQKESPQITFIQPRIDTKHLHISAQNMSIRKERYVEKTDAILNYAFSKSKCRSQMLLSYFGETDNYRCGVCDVCLERNKLELSNLEFTDIEVKLKQLLQYNTMELSALVQQAKIPNNDKVVKVIQWLIDNNKIVQDTTGMLSWNHKLMTS